MAGLIGGLNYKPQDCNYTESKILNVVNNLEIPSFEIHTDITQIPEFFNISCFFNVWVGMPSTLEAIHKIHVINRIY